MKLKKYIKINNLFNVFSIILNYSLYTSWKNCAILNHEVNGYLGPLLIYQRIFQQWTHNSWGNWALHCTFPASKYTMRNCLSNDVWYKVKSPTFSTISVLCVNVYNLGLDGIKSHFHFFLILLLPKFFWILVLMLML